MVQPVTVGLDIAKNVFHAYGVDAQGQKVLSRKLRRAQVEAFFAKLEPCLIGIEACATAHHWARLLKRMGHRVRLIPPAYVKPYVKTQKNDEADAEAICEAVTRPNMRFAEIKTIEQQSALVLHRNRAMLIKHRTRLANTIRAHLAEFGITESIGREGLSRFIDMITAGEDERITEVTRRAMMPLVEQYRLLQDQILDLDRQVLAWHRSSDVSKRQPSSTGVSRLRGAPENAEIRSLFEQVPSLSQRHVRPTLRSRRSPIPDRAAAMVAPLGFVHQRRFCRSGTRKPRGVDTLIDPAPGERVLASLLSAHTSSASAWHSQPQQRHHSAHGTRDVHRCSA